MFFRKTKKFAVGILLTLFVFSSFTEFILSAQPAQAQMAVSVIADAQAQVQSIWDTIKNGWKIAVMNATQQAVGYFMRKVAYDSAVWLASGGKGQSPFAHTNSVGSYLKNVGNDAAGAAIDSFGKTFGLDLCKVPDVKLDLALRIGLHYNYGAEPPKPACNLSTFTTNWGDSLSSVYNNGVDTSKIFSASLKVDDTDLGINIKTTEKIDRLYAQQTDDAKATRAEGGGFKAVTGLIDNRIKTPAAVTADEIKANAPNKQNDKSQAQIGAAMGSGAYEILPSTLSIFLNTLSSQMLKNFRENGMLPFGVGCKNIDGVTGGKCPTPGQNPNSAGTELAGRAAAEAVFSEFLTPKLIAAADYDILTQLHSCDSHGLYNCRADDSLVQAIQEAKQGDPLTIAEAMKRGFLHPTSKLIPPTNVTANQDPRCFDKDHNYCYSNIAVLRQLGVFPLGMEIAAKRSDPDNPATLEEVVKGFYKCSYVKDAQGNVISVNDDPINFPYCHLVDPNWVIKLEQTRCDALGYGTTPVGNDVPDRLQECMDVKTCVGRDSTGHCIGYGNCVREKNVWKFEEGQKCEPKYASCRSFTNSQGDQVAYLYRTLDTGSCAQSDVGCTAYSLNQNDTGWTSPAALAAPYTDVSNKGIYLNNKVSVCDASAAGCSAFKLVKNSSATNAPGIANVNTDLVYLKKAPDYLNCYDKDASAANGINWPQTLSDIIKMNPKAECNNYAKVCVASEVGCSMFKNVNDADAPGIPGKFLPAKVDNNTVTAWNDQCDARCVGYAAYQEMPTTYSGGNQVAYIIPPSKYNNNESGKTCTIQDNNCEGFTNMESSQAGGEKVENFTLLRNCIKPDETKQKNFYTYEGSKVGGYQLQSYTLQKYTNGSPLTIFKDQAERDFANQYQCNETLYKSNTADPDCRQFNDDQGNVYYSLISHTVIVSADCAQYRLNSQELAGTDQCFGNGQFKDGACYYYGLPGGVVSNGQSSQTCEASMVSCRAYKGNHGNNIKTIVLDASSTNPIVTFETADSISAAKGWSVNGGTVSISNEASQAGGHSLELSGNNAVLSKSVPILGDDVDKTSDQSYNLTFWAKGSGLNVSVGMKDDSGQSPVNAGAFSANSSWKAFKFNIKLPSSNAANLNTLTFALGGSGTLFLDNIRLTKVSDYIYLVKNSLKVDSICDDEPNDNLPGAALGCTAYNGPKNSLDDTLYYLTNFSYLCRDGAIGCTAFKDTFNKVNNTASRAYNIFLPGVGGTKTTATIGTDSVSCQVEQGKTGCYQNIMGHTLSEITAGTISNSSLHPQVLSSSYYIPADSTDSSMIYLVADGKDNSNCNAVDLGCTYAGKQTLTASGKIKYVTTTIKIDPKQFEDNTSDTGPQSGILCKAEAVGCDAYNSSKGTAYFKDPAVTGNKICSFKTFNDPESKQPISGWFWKGVSVCGNSTTLAMIYPKTYCSSDDECSAGNICLPDLKDKQACYPDYKKNGNYFDLWSFGDVGKYQNFVGECPVEQDTCSEFIDRADKDQAYYLFDNSKLTEGECAGQVSQKAGCALFDQTEKPTKVYDTAATYAKSDSTVGDVSDNIFAVTKVNPITAGNLDANRIISVKRDRECAEWLQCKASTDKWDDQQNKYVSKCTAVGLCNKLPSVSDPSGQSANCAQFITGQTEYSGKVLTESMYVSRDVSWKGKELVGLSILGSYPVEELWQFNIAKPGAPEPDMRLLKLIPCGTGPGCLVGGEIYSCTPSSTAVCGKANDGVCTNGLCLKDSSGNNTDLAASSIGQACRAYPEKDSPFPNITGNNFQNSSNLNKCFENGDVLLNPNDPTAQACDCDYTKATFGNKSLIKYFDDKSVGLKKYDGANPGICLGGKNDGQPCALSDVPAMPGICEKAGGACQVKDKNNPYFYGWKGFCLEYDKSRVIGGTKDSPEFACLSWLPLDSIEGSVDINANHPEAAAPMPDGTKYCVGSDLYRSGMASFAKCYNASDAYFVNTDSDCSDWLASHPDLCGAGYHADAGSVQSDVGQCIYGSNTCRVWCYPNDNKIFLDNYWYSKSLFYYQKIQVGCQAYVDLAGFKDQTAPWADRLWKESKSNFKKLDVSGVVVDYQNKLNYSFNSTSSPYAFLGDDIAKDNLYILRSCNKSGIFDQPLSSGACAGGSINPYKASAPNNFSYDSWNFVQYSNCTDDKSCNSGIQCMNHENNSTCQTKCKKKDGTADTAKCKAAFGDQSVCDPATFACSNPNNVTLSCTPFNSSSQCEDKGFVCTGKCSIGGTVSSTFSCSSDDTCYQKSCVGDATKTCLLNSEAGKAPTDSKSLTDKIKEAVSLLVQIYAKIPKSSIQVFSNSNQNYGTAGTDGYESVSVTNQFLDITGKPVTSYNGDTHIPFDVVPEIHGVKDCSTSGKCEELKSEGFNVNGKFPLTNSDNVIIDTKPYEAEISFFYKVDSNHMPAKRIIVDPDTGNPSDSKTTDGTFWNQRGYAPGGKCTNNLCENIDGVASDVACTKDTDCKDKLIPTCTADETKAPAFGYILNQTCDLHPYKTTVYYNCAGPTDPRWNESCSVLSGAQKEKWVNAKLGGCCVYQPKVQVRDNWGWCNGTCKVGSDGTDGCYSATSGGGIDECYLSKSFVDKGDPKIWTVAPNNHSNVVFKSYVVVPVNKTDNP